VAPTEPDRDFKTVAVEAQSDGSVERKSSLLDTKASTGRLYRMRSISARVR
jgi:hypothetical protein